MRRLQRRNVPVDLAKFPELSQVLTLAETARYIGVHRTTVMKALDDGYIAAVQVGGIWLISKRSAESYWWKPGTRQKKRRKYSSHVLLSELG
jgi:excisionase family DNA binding protein